MHMDPGTLPRTTVAVIGPGRVGTLLGTSLSRAGHRLVAVAGGSGASRDRLCGLVAGARPHDDVTTAAGAASLVVLAPPDDALADVVTRIAVGDGFREGQRVVHVSGAQGLGVLRRAALSGARVAACHPAQTVPRGATDPEVLVGAAWAVTADPDERGWARDLVEQLGGSPHDVPDEMRVLYHAALTLGANAAGAAVAAARALLIGARVEDPAAFLDPLVRASVANVLAEGAGALTGPVVRGDAGTLERHLRRLDDDVPWLAEVYRHLSLGIVELLRPTLDDEHLARLAAALEELP